MRTFTCLVVLLAVAVSGAAQSIHLVSAAGDGDFTTLQAAIDAAAPGDVLLVRPGEYAGAVLSGKPLTLLAAEGEGVVVQGELFVEGLPADTLTLINGLDVEGEPGAGQPALRAEHCAGTLWVQSCELRGSAGQGSSNASTGVFIDDCADVVFLRSTLLGGEAPFSEFFNGGRTGLRATGSVLWSFESEFRGSNGKPGDDVGGSAGSGAVISQGAQLFAADGDFAGGFGGGASDEFDVFCECFQCGAPGSGGRGLHVHTDSSALLHASRVLGGLGGQHVSTGSTGCAHGTDGQNLSVAADSSVTMFPGAARGLRVTPLVREQSALDVSLFGQAGESVWMLVGVQTPGVLLPAKLASLHVNPATAVLLPAGVLPPGGFKLLGAQSPTLPAGLDAVVLMTQAYFSGSGQLANATPSVILSDGN